MKYNETPESLARANVLTAIDQAYEHPSIADALQSYFDNLRDTLQEYGANEYEIRDAEDEFDRLASEHCPGWNEGDYQQPDALSKYDEHIRDSIPDNAEKFAGFDRGDTSAHDDISIDPANKLLDYIGRDIANGYVEFSEKAVHYVDGPVSQHWIYELRLPIPAYSDMDAVTAFREFVYSL